ncbi:MAG: lysophospholipid acyltransferase family protein [Myxococcota bacterium]|nr:lysophospholipid acyltransferase family protein [Myxococcota bacterium]
MGPLNMSKGVITLLSIWGWLMVSLCAIAGFCLQVVVTLVVYPFDRNRILAGRIFRASAVMATTLNPFWRFKRFTGPNYDYDLKGPAVVISNHCSHSDSFLISRLPWEMKWLGKRSLFKIPVVGWSMYLSGDIAVKRGDSSSVNEAMDKCLGYLAKGVPIMMFPEGTRSRTDDLLAFKDGAFRLAIQAGVPILPIAVHGTRSALPKSDWRFGRSDAAVIVGQPISTQEYELGSLDELKAKSRAAIETLRERLR